MKAYYLRLLAVSALAPIAACAEGDHGPSGPQVAIDVAPLTLPGTLGVSYALAVYNQDPTPYTNIFDVAGDAVKTTGLVWHQQDVTSNQFGNGAGGDISYVGPCDASSSDNWVALALNRVNVGDGNGSYDGAGAFSGTDNLLDDQNSAFTTSPGSDDLDPDFVNPAPYNKALVMKFPCEENEDTRVTFNLTVMRDADQGFFDIAVNFEDIFCSMKIDTCTDDGDDGVEPIKLLFGDEEGEGRVETAVIASACSAGTDDANTEMWMAPLQVSCDGGVTFNLDPTGGATESTPGEQGNQDCAIASAAATTAWGGIKIVGDLVGDEDLTGVTFTDTAGSGRQYIARYVYQSDVDSGGNGSVIWAAEAAVPGAAGNASFEGNVATLTFANYVIANGQARPITQVSAFTGGANAGTKTLCYALYWGKEDLQCDGADGSCNKGWWNVAINIDDLRDQGLKDCTVTTAITASSSTDVSPPKFVNGQLPGPGQTYGYVAFEAELIDTDGAPTCFRGPMGSGYAPVKYGVTKDILNGEAFPQLCTTFTPGDASPKQLKNISNYFFDEAATLANALYAGQIEAFTNAAGELVRYKKVRLDFAEMGAAVGGECGSAVKNSKQVFYFDAKWPDEGTRQELFWRGIGDATSPLVGEYTVQGWRRNTKTDAWVELHQNAIALDFSNTDNQFATLKAFARGAAFSASGYDSFAIELTRTDDGPSEDIKIAFGFVGGFSKESEDTPPFIFALCTDANNPSSATCTCHDTTGDTICPDSFDGIDIYEN